MTSPSTRPADPKDLPKDEPKLTPKEVKEAVTLTPAEMHPEPVSHLHDTPRPVVGETATEINERHAKEAEEALEGTPQGKTKED
jgi:hypothetical protein